MRALFITISASFLGIIIGYLIFPLIMNNTVEYEESIDEVEPNTGKTTYYLRVYHWKKGEIIRNEFYYDLTKKEIDSIKNIENNIYEKYKLLD